MNNLLHERIILNLWERRRDNIREPLIIIGILNNSKFLTDLRGVVIERSNFGGFGVNYNRTISLTFQYNKTFGVCVFLIKDFTIFQNTIYSFKGQNLSLIVITNNLSSNKLKIFNSLIDLEPRDPFTLIIIRVCNNHPSRYKNLRSDCSIGTQLSTGINNIEGFDLTDVLCQGKVVTILFNDDSLRDLIPLTSISDCNTSNFSTININNTSGTSPNTSLIIENHSWVHIPRTTPSNRNILLKDRQVRQRCSFYFNLSLICSSWIRSNNIGQITITDTTRRDFSVCYLSLIFWFCYRILNG